MVKLKLKKSLLALFVFTLLIPFESCKYTFTGASISPDVKTISIQFFDSYAALAPPTLSQTFTEALKDLFIRQTNLTLIKKNGDLQFDGQISGYNIAPTGIQSDDQAAANRLTITVDVRFVNTVEPEQNFETSFSAWDDFESNEELASKEDELIRNINERLVQDIFNRSVSNW